ncbi:MAG TPA: NUDIX hydrolase [Candidatus Saccharimonadales bacterium]|nr:NUDIX hydrolase [Candidatus Saccharimonadales bacterium]
MAEQIFQINIKGLIRNGIDEIFMVHIPEWGHIPSHWDLPGGRMDPGETFTQTPKRELKEELNISYIGKPKQLMGVLTNITIPVNGVLLPLVSMVYSVNVANTKLIELAKDIREDKFGWFSPNKAADLLKFKFSQEFCNLVRNL